MPVIWNPIGKLDVATDPADLPMQIENKTATSGAMTRCTNLHLDQMGIAKTRWGSIKLNATAIQTSISHMREQGGNRYAFGNSIIYRNEETIATGLNTGAWSTILYSPYNSVTEVVYGLNGINRKVIDGSTLREWGVDGPENAPVLSLPYAWYTNRTAWEADDDYLANEQKFTQSVGNYDVIYDWEVSHVNTSLNYVYGAAFHTKSKWETTYIANSKQFGLEYGSVYTVLYDWEIENLVGIQSEPPLYGIKFHTQASWEPDNYYGSKQFGKAYGGYTILFDWEAEEIDGGTTTVPGVTGIKFMWVYESSIVAWEATRLSGLPTVPGVNGIKFMWIFEYTFPAAAFLPDASAYKYMWPWEVGIIASLIASANYQIKYTYLRKNGDTVEFESNPSPAASMTSRSDPVSPIKVAWVVSPDEQITHVRIYRTLAAGTQFLFDTDYPISQLTAYSIKADGSLGTQCNWDNHDRPPRGTKVYGPNFGGICFILKDNRLYFCLPNQPEYWPDNYWIEVGPIQHPLMAGAFMDGQFFAASENEIYAIQGSGPTSFFPLPMSAICGTIAPEVFEGIKGYGIVHLGNDGLYQYTGGKDQKITYAFEPIFWGESKGSIPGMNRNAMNTCLLRSFNSKLYFAYPGGSATRPDNFLVWDLKNDRVQHYQYPVTFRAMAVDHENKRLLAVDTSGYVWELEKYGMLNDNGTEITWDIQTNEFSHLRKYFPRYAKYDVNLISGDATAFILLDDVSKQAHSLNGTRLTKKRLVNGCAGDRISIRVAGTGQVEIYGAEVE